MTVKDHPQALYREVAQAWLGEAYLRARVAGTPLPTPPNPAPDRVGSTNPDADTTRWEWDTDLTAQESATFDDVVGAAQRGFDLGQYAAVKDDLEGLRQYHGLASPTAAQTAAATKAIIRVLRVIIRDT